MKPDFVNGLLSGSEFVLCEHIFDTHTERRADARNRIDHEADQGAVAQADDVTRVDAIESPVL
jgi:hypothetical protein